MIAPVLVHLRQFFELSLKIIDRVFGFFLCGRIESHIGRRLGGVGGDDGLGLGRFAVAVGCFLLHFAGSGFLQKRVLFQLLLHQRLQFQRGRLQKRQ